jgi:hypothetical protein
MVLSRLFSISLSSILSLLVFSPDLEAAILSRSGGRCSLLTWRPFGWRPTSCRAVELEAAVAPSRLLSSFSLSLHYDAKQGDRGSTTVRSEVTEAA